MNDAALIWSYLASQPLLWLTATLFAYWAGDSLYRLARRNPAANPVMLAVIFLAVLLGITGTPYKDYFEGAQFVHFMLGPATVCLAVPLQANLKAIRKALIPIAAALLAGSFTAIVSALAIAKALGAEAGLLATLAPKSATAPVAIGISEALGGQPTLTAVLVLLTGMIGAIFVTPMMNGLGLKDWRARGFATGVAAHGIGTARAFQVHDTAGAFASIGMGLNAVLTAFLAPLVLPWFL
ncbi:putative murein hydrolase (TIGR00659 family) [Rhodobacter viridis]|uniref:Putative murein hydrolase (TIGR00659 family) n=1 Tax=Rhodobacter viridis TaxID=1054202 RepID=A0A318U2A5_9RHOB|nr:LrgB family protein [Rhodobacter viridis]PYF12080.1 putative murein hydrolase (TIGR00659 family) [Rhodobacter viridis]